MWFLRGDYAGQSGCDPLPLGYSSTVPAADARMRHDSAGLLGLRTRTYLEIDKGLRFAKLGIEV